MAKYLVRRLGQTVILMIVVTMATFLLMTAAPGGPSILLDPNMTAEQVAQMKRLLGLDQPIWKQYTIWMWRVVGGNLGASFSAGTPVAELIGHHLPNTLLLSGAAMLLSTLAAIPAGILSATRRHSRLDQVVTFASFFGISMPVFWYGLMLIVLFAIRLPWLPPGGMRDLQGPSGPLDVALHLVLPAIVLATANIAQLARYTRSSMISVMGEDYIRTARSKGVGARSLLYRHALKNVMIPIVTVTGLLLPRLVGGAAITETVFNWPGMGSLAVRAAFERDYPTIMGVTLVISVVVVLSNLIVDVLYVYLDPRIRY
ncbi:MAG: ABC transporter permease [Armatimonadetes bacterium]|nr:ABC transporter permease [Armatimonadota bacterium]